MFALLLGMSIFGVAITDIGNDNPKWEYVGAQECIPGHKKSGFSFTIGKKVFFKQKNIQILECKWDIDVPSYKVRGREYLKAQFSRFFLDLYFPGYENYIWMDSDTWIACPNTFDYYVQGSNQRGFAITPQVDRASPKLVNIKWFMNIPSKINSINFKNISKSISKDLANTLDIIH